MENNFSSVPMLLTSTAGLCVPQDSQQQEHSVLLAGSGLLHFTCVTGKPLICTSPTQQVHWVKISHMDEAEGRVSARSGSIFSLPGAAQLGMDSVGGAKSTALFVWDGSG